MVYVGPHDIEHTAVTVCYAAEQTIVAIFGCIFIDLQYWMHPYCNSVKCEP